jgi:hypothetical protein
MGIISREAAPGSNAIGPTLRQAARPARGHSQRVTLVAPDLAPSFTRWKRVWQMHGAPRLISGPVPDEGGRVIVSAADAVSSERLA